MAGPKTIQRFPKALLDWLGMKASSGSTPSELSDELVSVIDAGELYLAERLFSVQGICANLGVGNVGVGVAQAPFNTLVPAGEAWLVTDIGIYCNLIPAAATAEISVGILPNASISVLHTPFRTPTLVAGAAVASSPIIGYHYPRPMLMVAGEQVAFSCTKSVAGGWNPILLARGYRLTV